MAVAHPQHAADIPSATPPSDAPAFALPGAILVLDPALKPADRRAVIDSVLLAALAANKEPSDAAAWMTTMTQTLRRIGWVSQAFRSTRYSAPSRTLSLGRAVATAAEQLVDGPDPHLAVTATQRAADDTHAAEVVTAGGSHAEARTVCLALAHEQDGAPGLQLILVASRQESKSGRSQEVDLRTEVRSTDLQVSSVRFVLQRDIYRSIASTLHDKINDALARDVVPLVER